MGSPRGLPSPTLAAPFWPADQISRLESRRFSGAGTIAFDGRWFLGELALRSMEAPMLFPNAAQKLGLVTLKAARAVAERLAEGTRQVSCRSMSSKHQRAPLSLISHPFISHPFISHPVLPPLNLPPLNLSP